MSTSPHASHVSNKDFDFFYQGLAAQKLLIQQCASCGRLRNPPGPMCPHCQSLKWAPVASSGVGTIYSYIVHYHPPLPHFASPHPVVLVDLDEGVRMLAALRGARVEDIGVGMPVQVAFGQEGGRDLFWFMPVAGGQSR